MAERKYFSGSSLDQAVLAAARFHGIDPAKVAYAIREKKHGFLKARRRVVIEVEPDSPERDLLVASEKEAHSEHPEDVPSQEREWRGYSNRSGLSGSDLDVERAVKGAFYLLDRVSCTRLQPVFVGKGDELMVDLIGSDAESLIRSSGKGLQAVEHLLSRIVRTTAGESKGIELDCLGFKERHLSTLRQTAREAAEEALEEQCEVGLDPMNPSDRRVIHLELAKDDRVRTESEGKGVRRRVRVIPCSSWDR